MVIGDWEERFLRIKIIFDMVRWVSETKNSHVNYLPIDQSPFTNHPHPMVHFLPKQPGIIHLSCQIRQLKFMHEAPGLERTPLQKIVIPLKKGIHPFLTI